MHSPGTMGRSCCLWKIQGWLPATMAQVSCISGCKGPAEPAFFGACRASWRLAQVLYISGYADNELPDRDELGVEGSAFLQKPFSADSLGRKIRQILKN